MYIPYRGKDIFLPFFKIQGGNKVTEEKYVLQVKNIVKTFPGVKALRGVELRVEPGEIHALMGENGAGKSTLVNCIAGIYGPTSGEIIYLSCISVFE